MQCFSVKKDMFELNSFVFLLSGFKIWDGEKISKMQGWIF